MNRYKVQYVGPSGYGEVTVEASHYTHAIEWVKNNVVMDVTDIIGCVCSELCGSRTPRVDIEFKHGELKDTYFHR